MWVLNVDKAFSSTHTNMQTPPTLTSPRMPQRNWAERQVFIVKTNHHVTSAGVMRVKYETGHQPFKIKHPPLSSRLPSVSRLHGGDISTCSSSDRWLTLLGLVQTIYFSWHFRADGWRAHPLLWRRPGSVSTWLGCPRPSHRLLLTHPSTSSFVFLQQQALHKMSVFTSCFIHFLLSIRLNLLSVLHWRDSFFYQQTRHFEVNVTQSNPCEQKPLNSGFSKVFFSTSCTIWCQLVTDFYLWSFVPLPCYCCYLSTADVFHFWQQFGVFPTCSHRKTHVIQWTNLT